MSSLAEKVDLLLDQHVEELEERSSREPNDVVVVAIDFAHEHATETLRNNI